MDVPPVQKQPIQTQPIIAALIGNPNTGKSTLFNALAGLNARVGNYPGVTVEKKRGLLKHKGQEIELIDLPGTYSLSPRSIDEMVSVDVLLGNLKNDNRPDIVICIVDASNLERNLYLVSQILDIGLPCLVVLNQWDVAENNGIQIDIEKLQQRMGVSIVVTEAHRKKGIEELKQAILTTANQPPTQRLNLFPQPFNDAIESLRNTIPESQKAHWPEYLLERVLLDVGGETERRLTDMNNSEVNETLTSLRAKLKEEKCAVPAIEPRVRYGWAKTMTEGAVVRSTETTKSQIFNDRIDRFLTHWFFGFLFFGLLMFVVFQTIYTGAGPFMDWIDGGQSAIADAVSGSLPPGALRSLLVDGIVAGVGGVLIFLPQILLLFLFIAVLEDCGYMSRAAFLVDRLMTKVGLSGKSFVPLMSSFACAIPGVMAARVIENRKERLITILIAPLMSCSARLPVYLLMIGAFIPNQSFLGRWVNLHGLMLFGMTFLGAAVAIPIAWILKKVWIKGEAAPFIMELPSFKMPSFRVVFMRVYESGKAFVISAGTLIFCASVIIWAASYFPGDRASLHQLTAEIETLEEQEDAKENENLEQLKQQHNQLSSTLLENSFLGQAGHLIEPAVRPLGWDWKIGIGAIASFPAREVIIATLGTIYSLGGEIDIEEDGSREKLVRQMKNSKWSDGRQVYNIPVALSVMVFFALCAQCAATLMVIKRETNSWYWPIFTFTYMTALAYIGAFLTYQISAHYFL